jgi:septal ring factor EnvC (AmiA/AmiB activator)
MVSIAKPKQPIVVTAKSSQLVVEPIHVENPYFSITQPILIFGQSTNNLRQIDMFLEQAVHNVTTWLKTLQKLANLEIENEQIRKNMFETKNHLQTCILGLKTMKQTLKNHDKELVTVKGQLIKVQHENQNLSNKLKEVEHVVKKTKNLQYKYIELNQFNWKTHNDLKRFQIEFEQMTWDYNKMEESNM